jgi:primosomal protein N' (replication factor Y)
MRVVRVVPDVSGIDKAFDYTADGPVGIGSLVRIDLNGRRVGGWVTDIDVEPPTGVRLRPIAKVSSIGPSAEVVDLARWAAHRWSGRLASILTSASPERMTPTLPRPPDGADPGLPSVPDRVADAFRRPGTTLVRVPPTVDLHDHVVAAASLGDAVIVAPNLVDARHHGARLRRAGGRIHLAGRDFAQAALAGSVIGARSAVWATVRALAVVLVLDEHDESLQEERNPTWHARDVAIERARRAGVPCVLVSSSPSLAAIEAADRVIEPSRSEERAGWPLIRVADRRTNDPAQRGLFGKELVSLVRSDRRVLCVLNRKDRAKMLACATCGELVRTADGEHLMSEVEGFLRHAPSGEERPLICLACGGTKLKRLRLGVTRAAEELEVLAGRPIPVDTEAILHSGGAADAVVFLDFDQELLAPRYRAAEEAMSLLVRAARLVGPAGEVLVQTRTPDHRVLRAAVRSAPALFADEEATIRRSTAFPPFGALAEISGPPADEFVAPLLDRLDVTVLGPRDDGHYLLRADTPEQLADLLADTPRPKGRLRVAVDPPRA